MFNKIRAVTFAALMLATTSPILVNNTAVAQIQRPTKIASTVLVTVNGYQLTQSMVDSAIQVGEFLAGNKFSAADKQWIKEFLVASFRKNPVGIVQEDKFVKQVLSDIKKHSRSPINLALGRESLFANIYLSKLANNTVNQPSIMTIVYKYSPVLYANPKYKIVVTKRTADSLVASRNFAAKLAGKPLMTIDYNYWAQDLRRSGDDFSSPNIRKNFATAESRWVRLQLEWSKASPQQRQKIVALINQHLQRGHKIHNIARELESIASGENRTASSSNTAGQFNQAEFNHGMGMINTFRRMMAY
jgi:hypothetical protein